MTDAEGKMWLEDRVMKIQSVVEEYGEDQFCVSFSGGKDSTVVHYLLDDALPGNRIPRVYVNTGIEFVEMVKYVKRMRDGDDRITIITHGQNIQKMLQEHGYPFKSKMHSGNWERWRRNADKGKEMQPYIKRYLEIIPRETISGKQRGDMICPKCLRYQFSDDYKGLKISDYCCFGMKENTLTTWAKQNGKTWTILGLMKAEGGRRAIQGKCVAFRAGRESSFSPLLVISKEWEEWYIERKRIELCSLYYPPYNFERTGCKGCPFSIKLQDALDMMARYFPAERKQCELIWGPVYEEYRRLGYRLRKDDGQTSLFD